MSLIPTSAQEITTLVTNIAVVVTLVVLIYQVYLQRKEMEYNRYEKLMSDFSATTLSLIEHSDVLELAMADRTRSEKWAKYTEAQKKVYCYFDAIIALLERVYFGVSQKDWGPWERWVRDLSTNEWFTVVYDSTKNTYGVLFVEEMDKIIESEKSKNKIPVPSMSK